MGQDTLLPTRHLSYLGTTPLPPLVSEGVREDEDDDDDDDDDEGRAIDDARLNVTLRDSDSVLAPQRSVVSIAPLVPRGEGDETLPTTTGFAELRAEEAAFRAANDRRRDARPDAAPARDALGESEHDAPTRARGYQVEYDARSSLTAYECDDQSVRPGDGPAVREVGVAKPDTSTTEASDATARERPKARTATATTSVATEAAPSRSGVDEGAFGRTDLADVLGARDAPGGRVASRADVASRVAESVVGGAAALRDASLRAATSTLTPLGDANAADDASALAASAPRPSNRTGTSRGAEAILALMQREDARRDGDAKPTEAASRWAANIGKTSTWERFCEQTVDEDAVPRRDGADGDALAAVSTERARRKRDAAWHEAMQAASLGATSATVRSGDAVDAASAAAAGAAARKRAVRRLPLAAGGDADGVGGARAGREEEVLPSSLLSRAMAAFVRRTVPPSALAAERRTPLSDVLGEGASVARVTALRQGTRANAASEWRERLLERALAPLRRQDRPSSIGAAAAGEVDAVRDDGAGGATHEGLRAPQGGGYVRPGVRAEDGSSLSRSSQEEVPETTRARAYEGRTRMQPSAHVGETPLA